MITRHSNIIKFSYKVLKPFELHRFYADGIFSGNQLDKSHGYIHLCGNLTQTKNIIHKFYQFESVKILQFPNHKLIDLKFEQNKPGGEFYPHLYSKLLIEDIEKIYSIDFDENNINEYYRTLNLL
jgi:uncharacterized protein (DUF952 family)